MNEAMIEMNPKMDSNGSSSSNYIDPVQVGHFLLDLGIKNVSTSRGDAEFNQKIEDIFMPKIYKIIKDALKTDEKPGTLIGPAHGVNCSSCLQKIQGFLYRCLKCSNYYLCEKCDTISYHKYQHYMVRLYEPVKRIEEQKPTIKAVNTIPLSKNPFRFNMDYILDDSNDGKMLLSHEKSSSFESDQSYMDAISLKNTKPCHHPFSCICGSHMVKDPKCFPKRPCLESVNRKSPPLMSHKMKHPVSWQRAVEFKNPFDRFSAYPLDLSSYVKPSQPYCVKVIDGNSQVTVEPFKTYVHEWTVSNVSPSPLLRWPRKMKLLNTSDALPFGIQIVDSHHKVPRLRYGSACKVKRKIRILDPEIRNIKLSFRLGFDNEPLGGDSLILDIKIEPKSVANEKESTGLYLSNKLVENLSFSDTFEACSNLLFLPSHDKSSEIKTSTPGPNDTNRLNGYFQLLEPWDNECTHQITNSQVKEALARANEPDKSIDSDFFRSSTEYECNPLPSILKISKDEDLIRLLKEETDHISKEISEQLLSSENKPENYSVTATVGNDTASDEPPSADQCGDDDQSKSEESLQSKETDSTEFVRSPIVQTEIDTDDEFEIIPKCFEPDFDLDLNSDLEHDFSSFCDLVKRNSDLGSDSSISASIVPMSFSYDSIEVKNDDKIDEAKPATKAVETEPKQTQTNPADKKEESRPKILTGYELFKSLPNPTAPLQETPINTRLPPSVSREVNEAFNNLSTTTDILKTACNAATTLFANIPKLVNTHLESIASPSVSGSRHLSDSFLANDLRLTRLEKLTDAQFKLNEMGFWNRKLNETLLIKNNFNIDRTLNDLLIATNEATASNEPVSEPVVSTQPKNRVRTRNDPKEFFDFD